VRSAISRRATTVFLSLSRSSESSAPQQRRAPGGPPSSRARIDWETASRSLQQ
jgi:hypothetical protein